MSRTSYALQHLTWQEVARHLAIDSRLLFPIGALEQHGPHLPLGTNTLIAESLVRDLSDELEILRAPTLPYGVPTSVKTPFPGRSGFARKTLHRAVNDLLARWEDQGFTEIIVVTAHRYEPHLDALLTALTADSLTTVVDLYEIDVSDLLVSSPEGELGGELETSLMLHLAPELVRADRIADVVPATRREHGRIRGGMPIPPAGSLGSVGRPTEASGEKGRRIYARYRKALEAALARP